MRLARVSVSILAVLAGACSGEVPGDVAQYNGIDQSEVITALGTEPFWSATVTGPRMTYSTPDNIDGAPIEVTRFAGNGGLGFTGTLEGAALQMAVTPGQCTDGMSDRLYPFTVTLLIGDAQLEGCAYTDNQPFEGEETP